jgi:hypothetical protein
MVRRAAPSPTDERLKELIQRRLNVRGRFRALATNSGIAQSAWENFFYGKQSATTDMLSYWCRAFPRDQIYLMTGIHKAQPEDDELLRELFNDSPLLPNNATMAQRLSWLIFETFTSKEDVFEQLEKESEGKVKKGEWARSMLQENEPTIEMLKVAFKLQPQFVEWLVSGSASECPQVDPTSRRSWNAFLEWKKSHESKAAKKATQKPS